MLAGFGYRLAAQPLIHRVAKSLDRGKFRPTIFTSTCVAYDLVLLVLREKLKAPIAMDYLLANLGLGLLAVL